MSRAKHKLCYEILPVFAQQRTGTTEAAHSDNDDSRAIAGTPFRVSLLFRADRA